MRLNASEGASNHHSGAPHHDTFVAKIPAFLSQKVAFNFLDNRTGWDTLKAVFYFLILFIPMANPKEVDVELELEPLDTATAVLDAEVEDETAKTEDEVEAVLDKEPEDAE